MPIPKQPLTPSSSTDLAGQDQPWVTAADTVLELPPPAMESPRIKDGWRNDGQNVDHRRNRSSIGDKRKRAVVRDARSIELPPPPSRSRTIIQMQPGPGQYEKESPGQSSGEKNKNLEPKKLGGSTTGGRRAARKTAHSVIEKRRRSKMNLEFETMKDMIPACKGQTMHKLAILQAGIEYLHYLEQCVDELKTSNHLKLSVMEPSNFAAWSAEGSDIAMQEASSDEDDNDSTANRSDEEDYEDDTSTSPSASHQTAQLDAKHAYEHKAHKEHFATPTIMRTQARATRGPSSRALSFVATAGSSDPASTESIPRDGVAPSFQEQEADYEATTALLMLNGRQNAAVSGARGLSVQDLLIS